MSHTVRLTEQVRGRYDHVRPVLRLDFDEVLREPLDEVRVRVGGTSIGRRVRAELGPMGPEQPRAGAEPRATEIPVSWHAADHPALFPTMNGRIRIRDAGAGAIEVGLVGEYTPPLGVVGTIADRFAGHESATASLRWYVLEVAGRLEAKLREHQPVVAWGSSTTAHARRS
jgi:hypothetical protein